MSKPSARRSRIFPWPMNGEFPESADPPSFACCFLMLRFDVLLLRVNMVREITRSSYVAAKLRSTIGSTLPVSASF